jgi:hypothetical protein
MGQAVAGIAAKRVVIGYHRERGEQAQEVERLNSPLGMRG